MDEELHKKDVHASSAGSFPPVHNDADKHKNSHRILEVQVDGKVNEEALRALSMNLFSLVTQLHFSS
jgi:hypothetical protein